MGYVWICFVGKTSGCPGKKMDMLVPRKVSISLESVLFERLLNHFRLCETRQALSQNASPATLHSHEKDYSRPFGFLLLFPPSLTKKKEFVWCRDHASFDQFTVWCDAATRLHSSPWDGGMEQEPLRGSTTIDFHTNFRYHYFFILRS